MKTKVCIVGYGKMGKTIHHLLESENCELTHCIKSAEDWDSEKISQCDVAIEFTNPDSAKENIEKLIELNIPVVCGTTGWLSKIEEVHEKVKNSNTAFLYGSNFSLGMNLFFYINEYTAKLMEAGGYMPVIEEIHHTEKLDSPSGTAITLAEGIIQVRSDFTGWVNNISEADNQLSILSIREPNVPGTHSIIYENEIDHIQLTHTAKSRNGFAIGAIKSAKWLIGRKGNFTIRDYIDDLLKKS